MASKILRRIEAETGFVRLADVLSYDLAPSDLQSLMLTVYRARARSVKEARLMERGATPLCAPSSVDARVLNSFDRVAFSVAAKFDAIELSPVNPLGTNFVLGGIDTNNVVATVRNVEVLGDSTPGLALECARRRRNRVGDAVRLCSSHRMIRLQPFDTPGFTPHFRLFAIDSAGRDTGSHAFEIQHLGEHIRFYLELFRALNTKGFHMQRPLVELGDVSLAERLLAAAGVDRDKVREGVRAHWSDSGHRLLAELGVTLPSPVTNPRTELFDIPEPQFSRLCAMKDHVVDPLAAEFPEAQFRFTPARLEGLGYYTGLCLRISPEAEDGGRFAVADGGFTDWTARLLQDKKERLITSGIGAEFVCRRYRIGERGDFPLKYS